MNQQQRKELSAAVAALQPFADADHCTEVGLEATIAAFETAHSFFEAMAQDEQEKFDNMPEGLQNSERGEAIQTAAEALAAAADYCQEAIDLLDPKDLPEDWAAEAASSADSAIGDAESAI